MKSGKASDFILALNDGGRKKNQFSLGYTISPTYISSWSGVPKKYIKYQFFNYILNKTLALDIMEEQSMHKKEKYIETLPIIGSMERVA